MILGTSFLLFQFLQILPGNTEFFFGRIIADRFRMHHNIIHIDKFFPDLLFDLVRKVVSLSDRNIAIYLHIYGHNIPVAYFSNPCTVGVRSGINL